jgi:carbamate kinase
MAYARMIKDLRPCLRRSPRAHAVQDGYGTPQARPIRRATPAELREHDSPAGSMGPKIEAGCRFTEATGKPAAIGRLADADALLAGQAGTLICPTE